MSGDSTKKSWSRLFRPPFLAWISVSGKTRTRGCKWNLYQRSNFDRLKTVLQQTNTLSALTPEWLDLGVEHRIRYETFNQSFTKGTAGSDQMVTHRARILLGIKGIWDPIRFTLELADFRAPVADRGQDHNPNFVDHLDVFQLHVDLVSQNFLGTGTSGRLEVGRLVMDFGEGRLIAGHCFGSFTPSFDGVQ